MADVKKPEDDKTITDNKTPANEAPTTDKPAPGDNVTTYEFNPKAQKSNATEQAAQGDNPPAEKPKEEKAPDKPPARRGRPPNPDKAEKPKPEKPPKTPKEKSGASAGSGKTSKTAGEEKPKSAATVEKAPETPPPPPVPTEAPRTGEQEQIVYINLSELHPFKDHPFQVKQDAEMLAMVESVKDKGVTQPAIVRPREDGGYELVSGHRRHLASELSHYTNMPCIVRDLTDEQAITQMVEDNTNQRENILPSERGAALKMQLEAIKRQEQQQADMGDDDFDYEEDYTDEADPYNEDEDDTPPWEVEDESHKDSEE